MGPWKWLFYAAEAMIMLLGNGRFEQIVIMLIGNGRFASFTRWYTVKWLFICLAANCGSR
jgi:hypothetical protein